MGFIRTVWRKVVGVGAERKPASFLEAVIRIAGEGVWRGSATRLQHHLEGRVLASELPSSPSHLSAKLKVWQEHLLANGVELTFTREGRSRRVIGIRQIKAAAA